MENWKFNAFVSELKEGKYNCIVFKDNEILRFSQPGVKSLVTLLQDKPEILKGAFVFDKVIGKGAAALLILGEVHDVYADLISDHALSLLESADIRLNFNKRVPYIENKDKSGLCPIEQLSALSNDPKKIYENILNFIGKNKKSNDNHSHKESNKDK